MVDLVGDGRRELPDGVVREFGHVDDRVDTVEIGRVEQANVFVEGVRAAVGAAVQPTFLVEPGVDTDDVVAAREEQRREE